MRGLGLGIGGGGGLSPAIRESLPSLDLDFTQERYSMGLINKPFGDIITFTRASAATRINAQGVLETVAANVARIDHSPVNLATGTGAQNIAVTRGRTYAVSVVGGGSVTVSGAALKAGLWGVASGTVEAIADGNVTITPSGTVTALHFREEFGLLIEEQRTNYRVASDAFSVFIPKGGATVVDNAGVAPNGATVAALMSGITDPTAAWDGVGVLQLQVSGLPADAFVTVSAYVKSAGSTKVRLRARNQNTGTVAPTSEVPIDANWRRISSTHQIGANGSVGVIFGGADGNVLVAHLQVEPGSFASSYIPTPGAQATRAADVASINPLTPWYNQSAGTLFAEVSVIGLPPTGQGATTASLLGASGISDRLIVAQFLSTFMRSGGIAAGAVDNALLVATGITPSVSKNYKSAIAWNGLSAAGCTDGGPISTDESITVPAFSRMSLGSMDTIQRLNGHIRKLRHFPRRLPDAELQALTA